MMTQKLLDINTKEHTNLCNIKDTTKIHNTRIIERRPTFVLIDETIKIKYSIIMEFKR